MEAMKKGAYDFIAKPFTPDQLRFVVKRAHERRTLQREAEFLRSERERSLRDVATEKSRVKTIINCMGDGILVCDRDSCIVLANPAAGRMLKISESSLRDTLRIAGHPSLPNSRRPSKQVSQAKERRHHINLSGTELSAMGRSFFCAPTRPRS